MQTLGRHLIIELYGCDSGVLNDVDGVEATMLAAARAVGATPLERAFRRFTPQGVSGTLVIAESHLSIHTWPQAGYAAVDIFTCGGLDPGPGIEVLKRLFGAAEVRSQEIVRGLPDEVAEHVRLRPQDVRIVAGELGVEALEYGLRSGWFTEGGLPGRPRTNVHHRFRVEQVLAQVRTPFQDVLIFDNPDYGRVLVLDGQVQLTTSDERIYHELLVHPAMASHPSPGRVLIVGGGDGGALREVLAHDPVEVVMIDIDADVVALCREHLPGLSAGGFDDPRLTLLHQDASAAIARYAGYFDVAIVDCNDPIGPSAALFTAPFYAAVGRAMRPDGLCAIQGGSFLDPERLQVKRRNLALHWAHVAVRRLTIPSYHRGEYGFMVAAAHDPAGPPEHVLAERLAARGLSGRLRYYTPATHHATLCLYPGLEILTG